MLLSTLTKHTPSTHADYRELVNTLEKIKELLNFLDELKRREDNKRKIQQMLSNLSTPKHKLPRVHPSPPPPISSIFVRSLSLPPSFSSANRTREMRY
jgi:hypothetical protein